MPMPEKRRQRYNRDCASTAEMEKAYKLSGGSEKREATARLKSALIAFDQKWNDRTPTDAQLAMWLQALAK